MINKIKQLLCNHIYMMNIYQDYMSVGDKYDKRVSARIVLRCSRCNKETIIYDKGCEYINWITNGKVISKD